MSGPELTGLIARDVRFGLGTPRRIDGVSLRIAPGELHVLLGPNGAGKSTLLGLLAGDLKPTEGNVVLDDQPLARWSMTALARRRAVMMQREHLPFPFTVREVVSLGRLPWQRDEASPVERRKVTEALAQAGAAALADRRYPELSGGERARVQLARALAQIAGDTHDEGDRRGCYLLLDEPTASLDFAFQHHSLITMRQLADRGVGVLAILQDPNLALRHADVVSLLDRGRLVASGSPAEVLDAERLSTVYGLPIEALRRSDGSLAQLIAGSSR